MQEARFYKKLKDDIVQCGLCNHFCVLKSGELGFCHARKNVDGKLYSLVYGYPVSVGIDPIEKKPLFHFLPGSDSFSFGTFGCNFRCKNCQNFTISQEDKIEEKVKGEDKRGGLRQGSKGFPFVPPQAIVNKAKDYKCQSISYTYVEPTIFAEYALDIMKLAHREGLKNVWVSNGFMSSEALNEIMPYLDAVNIDVKSFDEDFYRSNCQARLKPILENLKVLKENKIHTEITTLLIPTLSDSPEMIKKIARFIHDELGADTPWHLSRFSPEISWKLQALPKTDLRVLEEAYEIGKTVGLKNVYLGNMAPSDKENTYCSQCGEIAIERHYYKIKRFDKNGKCRNCGADLNIKF